ncbi:MAG: hypothetical protein ACM3ZE_15840, partial [Myxococcales bacterium]
MGRSKKRIVIPEEFLVGSLVALPWIWLCSYFWDYYPLWDSAIYYEETLNASATTLNPLAYNFAAHPTMGYLYLPGLLLRLFGRTYHVFLVYNAILAWCMAMAVCDIWRRLVDRSMPRLETLLVVASAMYCPVIVASIVQLSPDFGVLVFLTLATRALLRERFTEASLWGMLAGFSKESGVLLYAVELAVFLIAFSLRAPGCTHEKLRAAMRRIPLLTSALVAPFIIKLFIAPRMNQSLSAGDPSGLIRQFLSVSFLDNLFPASLATILVLNFMWIPAAVVVSGCGIWCIRRFALRLPRNKPRDPTVEFLAVLFAAELVLLTRFRTFTNVRYYLPLFPWIVLLAARLILGSRWPRPLRLLGQSAIMVAFGWANLRSVDPVSARVFGTIPFGEHRFYHVTSLTRECCGLGRDQLVYNLEFTELDRILRELTPFVLSSTDHAVAVHPEADWYMFHSLHPQTKQRSTPVHGSFRLPYVNSWTVGSAPLKPAKIYYVALPHMPTADELSRFAAWYSL